MNNMVPIGYVFRPTPEELLWILADKIVNKDRSVPPPEIQTLELYEEGSNPWTILDQGDDQPCYVMTKLRKAGPGQSRTKRTAGVGTWKEQSSGNVKFVFEGLVVKGLRKYFVFQPKKGSSYSRAENGHWIMNEYSFGIDQDLVVCEIHNKDGSKSKSKRKRGEEVSRLGFWEKRVRDEVRVLEYSGDRVPVEQCDDTRGGSSSRGVSNSLSFPIQGGFSNFPAEFTDPCNIPVEQCDDTRGGSIMPVGSFDRDRGSSVEINLSNVPADQQCEENMVHCSNPLLIDFPVEVLESAIDLFWKFQAAKENDPTQVLGINVPSDSVH